MFRLTLLVFLGGIFSFNCYAQAAQHSSSATAKKGNLAGSGKLTAELVYSRNKNSIVVVRSAGKQGSGVALFNIPASGELQSITWVVTNAHVVGNESNVEVGINGFKVSGSVEFRDEQSDIAFVLLNGTEVPPVLFGTGADSLVVGQKVYAIGAPLGLTNSLSDGVIAGIRSIDGRKYIQTTAQMSPGNSGGALLDSSGRLIGINSFKVIGGESLNFAIELPQITRTFDALAARAHFKSIFPEKTKIFDDDFVRWMTQPNGYRNELALTVFEDAKNVFYAGLPTRQSQGEFEEVLFGIAEAFSKRKSSREPSRNVERDQLALQCDVELQGGVTKVTYTVDLSKKTVNGYAATVSDREIRYIYGNASGGTTQVILDRINGTVSVTAGRPLGAGICKVLRGQAF